MKRFFCITLLIVIAVTSGAAQDVETFTALYNGAEDISDQLAILQDASTGQLSGADEFFANALRRLLTEYPMIRKLQNKDDADSIARLLANELGTRKYLPAGQNLWRVVEVFPNAVVKADALIALGKMGAVDLFPQVVQILQDMNAHPTPDRQEGERIAFGAILSLENYGKIEGYLPVYFASTAWYSDRVRNQALASMEVLAEDPTEQLIELIRGSSYSYEAKYRALYDGEANSRMSPQSKAQVAVAALDEGWRTATREPRYWTVLTNMRKLAIGMINRYRTEDAAVYPLLERSYRYGTDTQEKLDAVAALASLATDDAVRRLSNFIMIINGRLQAKVINADDQQMIRALISAVGNSGNSQGRLALQTVTALNWTNPIKALAHEALEKLK
jgi:hypothetical protein